MTPMIDPEEDLKALYKIGASKLKNPPKLLDKPEKRDMMDIKVMKESIKDLTERVEHLERVLRKYIKNVKTMQVNSQNPVRKLTPTPTPIKKV